MTLDIAPHIIFVFLISVSTQRKMWMYDVQCAVHIYGKPPTSKRGLQWKRWPLNMIAFPEQSLQHICVSLRFPQCISYISFSYWFSDHNGIFFILEQNSISGACLLRKCCKGRAREGGDGGIIKETRDQYQVLWGSEGSDRWAGLGGWSWGEGEGKVVALHTSYNS